MVQLNLRTDPLQQPPWCFLEMQKEITSLSTCYFGDWKLFCSLKPLVASNFHRDLHSVGLWRTCLSPASWFAVCPSKRWGVRGGYTLPRLESHSRIYRGHCCYSFTVRWTRCCCCGLDAGICFLSVISLGAVGCDLGNLQKKLLELRWHEKLHWNS